MMNVSLIHFIQSHLYYLHAFNSYRNKYRNYFYVMRNVLRNNFPVQVIEKNGSSESLTCDLDLMTNLSGIEKCYEIIGNDVIITKKNLPPIRLYNGIYGSIFAVFLKEEYKMLPIKGNTVIDIGANIGDSPIYFALNGAKKVIAVEPIPRNFEAAEKNVISNGLSDKITLVFGGVSNKIGSTLLDSKMISTGSDIFYSSKIDGVKVKLFTLENILNAHNIHSAVLKMDCEGCEYDSILSCSNLVLQRFSHMSIEYHYGYQNLKKKLEDAGFKVSVTVPKYAKNPLTNKKMYSGFISAEREGSYNKIGFALKIFKRFSEKIMVRGQVNGPTSTFFGNKLISKTGRYVYKKIKPKFIKKFGYKLYLDLDDQLLLSINEYPIHPILKKIIHSGDTIMDIGAGIGILTLFFRKLVGDAGMIYSFEPNSTAFSILNKNIKENALTNIQIENKAVSDTNSKVSFILNNSITGSRISRNDKDGISVDSISIDKYSIDNKIKKINFIKIDTEGYDLMVLKGMTEIIESNPELKIMVEYHTELLQEAGIDPKDLIKFLQQQNFKIYDMGGLFDRFELVEDLYLEMFVGTSNSTNLLCTHTEINIKN